MGQNFMELAFTDGVRAAQEKQGSRASYQRMEDKAGDQSKLSHREILYIQQRDGFYLSTIGENGWPYVQFRGGPKGFLKVIDESTLAYADFRGNMQYISSGNIATTKKATLILLDYPSRTRVKIWAEAEIIAPESNPDLLAALEDPNYKAQVDRIIKLHVKAFDWNCPQHITPKFTIEEMQELIRQNPSLLKTFTEVVNESNV